MKARRAIGLLLMAAGLTVRLAEQRSTPKSPRPGGQVHKDPNIADLESNISSMLGLKVQVIHRGDKGGEMRISYKTLEQLDELTKRLSRLRQAP